MRALYAKGYEMGRNGAPWKKGPAWSFEMRGRSCVDGLSRPNEWRHTVSDMPRDSQNKTSNSTDKSLTPGAAPVEPGANAVKMAGELPAGNAPVMIVPHAKQAELPQSDPDAPTPVQLAAAEPPRTSKMAAIIVALTVLAIVGLSLWYLVQPQPLLVQGEADATRVDIAARIDGRVGERPVSRGDNVTAAQLLVAIDNPELLTKLHEAEAARVVA